MTEQIEQAGPGVKRWIYSGALLLMSAVLVPVGGWAGWHLTRTPSQQLLLAAAQGQTAALEDLVLRVQETETVSGEGLDSLLLHNDRVVSDFGSLVPANETVMDYLIASARSKAPWVVRLADYEISYDTACDILDKINPHGIAEIKRQAATLSNACFLLGVAYELGRHVEQNWEAAAIWYGQALQKDYEVAYEYFVESAYQAGIQHQKSEDPGAALKAVEWYAAAAHENHSYAQLQYGLCYKCGYGVEKNTGEAVEWFRASAEQGCPRALYELGRAYALGEGVLQDKVRARQLYAEAAELGDAEAQFAMGNICYFRANRSAQDNRDAMGWFEKAANQNHRDALLRLSVIYQHGMCGEMVDIVKALEYRQRAKE
ncbi:MAG: SEL1-like repeat protein [Akkermansiaceae bacterium]|nr:SEL1-like repeat protein [Akkermansiaceae bacterium]